MSAANEASASNAELSGYYQKPAHGWTCFHCGETFKTVGSARVHFGAEQDALPGCIAQVRHGGERGLLMALREAEGLIAQYAEEDGAIAREMARMQIRHAAALIDAEEACYARGVRDGLRLPADERAKLLPDNQTEVTGRASAACEGPR